jgi:hypothetical protein
LAYRITANDVFRGGYGIFTVSPNFDQVNTLQNTPPIGAKLTAINTTVNPVATIQNPFPAALISTGGTPTYNYVSEEPGQHHINPYYQNWNAQLGHEFTKTDVLEVRYVIKAVPGTDAPPAIDAALVSRPGFPRPRGRRWRRESRPTWLGSVIGITPGITEAGAYRFEVAEAAP